MPHSSRPRFLLAAVVCVILGGIGGLLAARLPRAERSQPARFYPPREPPPTFRLRDQDGRWTSPRDARGKVLVLTFLYSTCRDLCPRQAAEIRDAVVRVGGGAEVYGISVDPVGDTPDRARRFLEHYHLAGGPVHFLLGSRRELRPVWAAYGIVPIAATPAEAAAAAGAYDRARRSGRKSPVLTRKRLQQLADRRAPNAAREPYPFVRDLRYRGRPRHGAGTDFEHSAYVMLIDKHGRQRVGLPFEQVTTALLEHDMRKLLAEA
jgi:protein SCO1/2